VGEGEAAGQASTGHGQSKN